MTDSSAADSNAAGSDTASSATPEPRMAPCPGCHSLRPVSISHCPSCGLPLIGELAAHLRHIDEELHGVGAAMCYPANSTQAYFGATSAQVTQRYRELLAQRVTVLEALYAGQTELPTAETTAPSITPSSTPPATPIGQPSSAYPYISDSVPPVPRFRSGEQFEPGQRLEPGQPETSPKVIQNTLLILSGILLTSAAVAFTVFAWGQFGLAGRATILSAASLIMLAVPVLIERRGLRATSETLAVLGFALLLLDGYAAWQAVLHETLSGTAINAFTYSAAVGALVCLIALLYRILVPLRATSMVAAIVAHTVPPLFALGIATNIASNTSAFSVLLALSTGSLVVVAADLGALTPLGTLIKLHRTTRAIIVAGAVAATSLGTVSALSVMAADAYTGSVLAAAGLTAGFALLITISGVVTNNDVWSGVSAAFAALLLWSDTVALLQKLYGEESLTVTASAAVGLVCACFAVLVPVRGRVGATVGASIILSLSGIPLTVWTLLAAWGPIGKTSGIGADVAHAGLRMLCGVVLVCIGWALLNWRSKPAGAGLETAIGPALLAVAVFTTTIAPITAAPVFLLVALPLFGAAMITGAGIGNTGISREGTFGAGLLLSLNALARGAQPPSTMIATIVAIVVLYATVAALTKSGSVRVSSTAVSSLALLALAGPITAYVGGGELLASYLLLIGVVALIGTATAIATTSWAAALAYSVTLEVSAGIGALVAVMLSLTSPLGCALMVTILAALLAAIALRESRRAAIWWALGLGVLAVGLWLRAAQIHTVEGYTIPLALALVLVGLLSQRNKPEKSSWVTFGPALLMGIVPTLAVVLFGSSEPLRALILGTVALLLIGLGAISGRQAPFILGVLTVAAVAARVGSPLLPRITAELPVWVPLAVAGATLLVVGAGYERGRRDVRRLVGAIRKME